MNLIPRWAWLQAIRGVATNPRRDAAEMGTAYGLDESFDERAEKGVAPPVGNALLRRSALTGLPRQP